MKRLPPVIVAALFVALALVAATALATAAPAAGWAGWAAPLLLALAVLAADGVLRRRAGGSGRPSPGVAVVAAAIVAAGFFVARGHPERLAALLPILGAGAAVPFLSPRAGASRSEGAAR